MPAELRYIFYGGVEGVYPNSNGGEDFLPDHGATAFGYTEGQLLTGFISFSGTALDIINANLPPVPLTAIEIPLGSDGIDFFFPQPRVGDYTEADMIGIDDPVRQVLEIQFTGNPTDPLAHLATRVFDGADGPNVFVGAFGVDMNDDNDAQARVDGIWLPESIVPDFISGDAGNNTLRGTKDYNFLAGGEGNDTVIIKTGQGWAWGGDGNDTLKGGDQDDLLFGGYGDDRLVGGRGNDLLKGGAGTDDLRGEEGNDVLIGGLGNDKLKGGSGDDSLSGGSGDDQIAGNDGVDNLDGGNGNDYLDAGSGNDFLSGGTGNDGLHGGSGEDQYVFFSGEGAGHDTIYGFQDGVDTIVIVANGPLTFAQLFSTAVVNGDDVTLTYGFENTITFDNTSLSELTSNDFLIF